LAHKTCVASIERERMRKKMDLNCFKVLSRHSVKRMRKITKPQFKMLRKTIEIPSPLPLTFLVWTLLSFGTWEGFVGRVVCEASRAPTTFRNVWSYTTKGLVSSTGRFGILATTLWESEIWDCNVNTTQTTFEFMRGYNIKIGEKIMWKYDLYDPEPSWYQETGFLKRYVS